jgi:hypothetical protein
VLYAFDVGFEHGLRVGGDGASRYPFLLYLGRLSDGTQVMMSEGAVRELIRTLQNGLDQLSQ